MDIQANTGAALIAEVDPRLCVRAALPPQELVPDHWAGMLFRVRDRLLLAPLDQIVEVLGVPDDVVAGRGARTVRDTMIGSAVPVRVHGIIQGR